MHKRLFIPFLSFFLIGCGGGGSSSTSNSNITPQINIDEAYSGLKTSARLTPVFANEVASDYLFLEEFTLNLLQTISPLQDDSLYENNENTSEACQNGGKQYLNISKESTVGIADLIFENCRLDEIEINGSFTLNYNLSTNISKVRINNYKITKESAESVVMNGTIEEADGDIIVLNILSDSDDSQLLAKNLKFDKPYSSISDENDPYSYEGQLFYSELGKVNLNIETRTTSHNSILYSQFGEGALLRIEDSNDNSASFQIIDDNGYAIGSSFNNGPKSIVVDNPEATVEINFISEDGEVLYGKNKLNRLLSLPAAGEKPIANEVLSGNESSLIYPDYQSISYLGDGIQFDGRTSVDPEGALLSYSWEIIDSPSGSNAKLSSTISATPNLSVDYLGIYKVQMVVSDGTNNSDPKIISVEVGSPEFNPLSRFGGISWIAEQLDGSFSDGPTFKPLTSLGIIASPNSFDVFDFLKFNIDWNLIEKPSISNSQLTEANSINPSFIPDEKGLYTIEATVDNGFIEIKDTENIEVSDFDEAVTPQLIRAYGHGIALVGTEQNVDLEHQVGIGSNNYTSSLVVIEQPSGSNPQTSIVSNQISNDSKTKLRFTFDKVGRYIFKINTKNDKYNSEPLELVFNAFDSTNVNFKEDSFTSSFTSSGQSYIEDIFMGDLDQDGFNDIVFVYRFKYQILYGKADGTFRESSLFDIPAFGNQLGGAIGLIDINNDSKLELAFRHSFGNIVSFVNSNGSELFINAGIPVEFHVSFLVHTLSDINNDGLKDIILMRKPNIHNNEIFEGIYYSLQTEGNVFSTPVPISTSIKNISKISHDEINNSLLVVSGDDRSFTDNDYKQTVVTIDEYKYQGTDFTLKSSSNVNYAPEVLFGSHLEVKHIVDLIGDDVKELVAEYKISGNYGTVIMKKDSLNNSYEIDQKITSVFSSDMYFEDIDSDGDIDISGHGKVLYQDENNQFNSIELIESDNQRELLPLTYDIDNDNDFDFFNIQRFFIGEQPPNIKVIRNTIN